jgi:integrase
MAKVAAKLTETMIARAVLMPGEQRTWLWDTKVTGFHVRVLAGGSKTFWYQYRTAGGRAGKTRLMRIGTWPDIKLDVARDIAQDYANQVALARRGHGQDPAAAKQEAERVAGSTLRALLAEGGEYERHLIHNQIVNAKVVISGLRRGLAKLMGKHVRDIAGHEFVKAITAIEHAGKPGAAADLRKFARTFCGWCVENGYAPTNVMANLKRRKPSRAQKIASDKRKARALVDHEIIAVWNACAERGAFGNIIRLLLLTGARRGEIAKLKRDQLKPDRIVLPPLSTKSGEQHEVPLTELMRVVIAAQPKGTSKLLFASEKTGAVILGWTKLIAKLQKDSGVKFTPHDLRRTCRTLMSHYRVEYEVRELAIGHQRQGLDRLYDFAELWELRTDAFRKVSDHVARLIKQGVPGNVVALPPRS